MSYWYCAEKRGFYESEVDGSVKVTDARYADLMAGQAQGKEIVPDSAGNPVLQDPVQSLDLDRLKSDLMRVIDATAETQRLRYITGGAGQAMTYTEKAAQAKACLADEDPDAADYPMLAAEIGITGESLTEVATVVNAAYQQWLSIWAQIEAVRLGAKAAVAAASSTAASRAAFDAISWPSA